MFPMYRDTSPRPYPGDQTPLPQFFNPTWEPFPPQTKVDQSNVPRTHEHWPYSYGHPCPTTCQNCCSHGQQPYYQYFRPPYPHFPSPPPFGHYYGAYPYPPAAFPQHYPYVPPPYYPMEMPRYEYDKGLSNSFHCCECPNHHPSHGKSTSNVKIEEHEPEGEVKKSESLVPAEVGRSPYPVLWVPPEYMMKEERPSRVAESDADKQRVAPQTQRNQVIKPVGKDPNDGYQWFPLDKDTIKRLLEGGEVLKPHGQKEDRDENKALDLEKNCQNKQFSYPVFWVPYDGRRDDRSPGNSASEEQEERHKVRRPGEKHPSAVDVVKFPDREPVAEKTPVAHRVGGDAERGSQKSGNVRVIPVKQLDDHVAKSSTKEQESEVNASMRNGRENVSQESATNGTDVKTVSSTKKCKLPPICLRVDPLRKKNGKGSSRSPSPPCKKAVQKLEESKEQMTTNKASQVLKEEVRAKESVENYSVSSGAKEELKVVQDADTCKLDCGMNVAESREMKESKLEEDSEQVKKKLSETEAAVIVQSAYRGYAVRRWEPLKKLRQIADVNEEAGKIRRHIEKLESCVTVDNKEKVAVGENIMNLLLKLDTVQGLLPSVRDIRKSVAKELITLQEKLDCIESRISIPTDTHISAADVVQEHSTTVGCVEVTRDAPEISEQGKALEKREQPQNEELVQPVEIPPDYVATEPQEPTSEAKHSEDTPEQLDVGFFDRDQEGNLLAESTQDHVEDDICRMDWECDLGAVKTNLDIVRETTPSAEAAKKIEENVEDDISRMDWECDLGAAKIVLGIDQQTIPVAEAPEVKEQVENALTENYAADPANREVVKEKEGETCEVDSSTLENKVEDQPDDKPVVERDNSVAVEHSILVETSREENPSGQAYKPGPTEVGQEISIFEHGPTSEVEEVLGLENYDDEPTQLTCLNEYVENRVSGEQTMEKTGALSNEPVAADLLEGKNAGSDNMQQMERSIIEENEKLRDMVEKLLASGKQQQDVIAGLTAKVKNLEKKQPKRSKLRSVRRPGVGPSRAKSLAAH